MNYDDYDDLEDQELNALGVASSQRSRMTVGQQMAQERAYHQQQMQNMRGFAPGGNQNIQPPGQRVSSRRSMVRRIPFVYTAIAEFDDAIANVTSTITIGADGGFTCTSTKGLMVYTSAAAAGSFLGNTMVRVRDGSSGQEFMNIELPLNLYTDCDISQSVVNPTATPGGQLTTKQARVLPTELILAPNSQLIVDWTFLGVLQADEDFIAALSFIGYRTFVR